MRRAISPRKTPTMTDEEFEQFRTLVYRRTHIACPDSHQILFERKVRIRVAALRLNSFRDYYAFLTTSDAGEAEFLRLVDVVAIHETSFFRIPGQFQELQRQVFPDLLNRRRSPIRVWSAGCSSGEEPYGIAMAWLEMLRHPRNAAFSAKDAQILATDISPEMIAIACAGIYPPQKVHNIPQAFLDKYLECHDDQYRLTQQVQTLVTFQEFNLINITTPPIANVDVIFCRNLLIYFDRPAQIRLITELTRLLDEGGYLFLGDAESLHPFQQVSADFDMLESGNAIIYQKRGVHSS